MKWKGLLSLPLILLGAIDKNCSALQPDKKEVGLAHLVQAICIKESNCDPNAIGDDGRAAGITQMHCIMVDEVNRICKLLKISLSFDYDDRWNAGESKRMCLVYLRFCQNYFNLDYEQLARGWNGGMYGWKKVCTRQYGKDVIKIMKGLEDGK
jgi:hypothetical protein